MNIKLTKNTLEELEEYSNGEFDFQLKEIIDIIIKNDLNIIGLQFPEGLKRKSIKIASCIEKFTGKSVIISANPCYGACDIDTSLLNTVDILFHFGHSKFGSKTISKKVHYIECASNISIKKIVKKAIPMLDGDTIGLITTVQHVHTLKEIFDILKSNGKNPIIGIGDGNIAYPGQVLGCNFSVIGSECDEYIYIGSGEFHPIGASLVSKKRVLILDPFLNEVRVANSSKILHKRIAVISNSANATVFGILVSTKNGQNRMDLAISLKKLAEKYGKKALILTMDLITKEQLLQFKVDAFINTACPRLAIDESGRFNAPMLTPQEFEILLGEREWEDFVFDEMRYKVP